jgi:hypothetical protein
LSVNCVGDEVLKLSIYCDTAPCLSIYGSTVLCRASAAFQVPNLYTVGRTSWTGDQPVERPLPIHRTTQTQNKRTQTCMPRVGFELMTPVFERAKTVHALDCVDTAIGYSSVWSRKIQPTFRRKMYPTSSWSKSKRVKKSACCRQNCAWCWAL